MLSSIWEGFAFAYDHMYIVVISRAKFGLYTKEYEFGTVSLGMNFGRVEGCWVKPVCVQMLRTCESS